MADHQASGVMTRSNSSCIEDHVHASFGVGYSICYSNFFKISKTSSGCFLRLSCSMTTKVLFQQEFFHAGLSWIKNRFPTMANGMQQNACIPIPLMRYVQVPTYSQVAAKKVLLRKILRKAIIYLKANHGKTEALNFAGIGLKHLHEETQFWGIKRPGGVLNRTGFMRA